MKSNVLDAWIQGDTISATGRAWVAMVGCTVVGWGISKGESSTSFSDEAGSECMDHGSMKYPGRYDVE